MTIDHHRRVLRRTVLAAAAAAVLGTLAAVPASAASCTWQTVNGNWGNPLDWDCGFVPGSNDLATIGGAGIVTVDVGQVAGAIGNAGAVNIDAFTLTLSGNANGGNSSNSGTITAGGLSSGSLLIFNTALNNTGGQIVVAGAGSFLNQFGSSINGGTLSTVNGGLIQAGANGNNFLNGVTLGGTLDLASAQGIERVSGGLTLNGTVNIGQGSVLAPQGDQTITGNGTIVFADGNAGNRLNVEAGTLTLASSITVRGSTGRIGQQAFAGGAATLINNGTIQADVGGGTITLQIDGGGGVANNGTLAALNGGTLLLNSNVSNGLGSQILAGAGSTVIQNGVALNGTINVNGGGSFTAVNSGNNILSAASFTGTLDLANAQGIERAVGGLTLNGTVNIGQGSVLAPQGDQTITGNGTIVFADGNASNRLNVEAGTLTLDSGITVRGNTGRIGQQGFVGGAAALINNGKIQADVGGGTITLQIDGGGGVTNNGTLAALNGGTLLLNSNVSNGAGSQILAGAGSTVIQNGVALNGTINVNGGGSFSAVNSGSNIFSAASFTGTLDLASAQGVERVVGGLTLNGGVNIAQGSVLAPQGDQTITGNGTIVFADGNAGNRLNVEAGTLTLDSGITVRGNTGRIGQQGFVGGAAALINNGKIQADVGGGTITLQVDGGGGVTNNGTLAALNGGTLLLNSNVSNNAGSQILAGAGSTVIQNGVTLNGTINVNGGGLFTAVNSGSNVLSAASFTGTLDLASAQGVERVVGGLTLNGGVNIAQGSLLAPQGDQTITGNGTIVFADGNPSNRLNVEAGTLTLDSGITVRGNTGRIGQQAFVGGAATLINNGKIQADVGGGTITLQVDGGGVTNNGTLAALNGGTLLLNSNVSNNAGSQILAGAGSTVIQNGVTLNGTINVNGGGLFTAVNSGSNFLSAASFTGTLDLASAQGIERVVSGLTLNGSVRIGSGSLLAPQGDQTITGNGTIVFADGSASNRLNVEAGALTLDSGITVHGVTGVIGQQAFAGGAASLDNRGTINADGGGTITLSVSGPVTNNGTIRAQNGTVSVQSSLINNGTLRVDAAGLMNLPTGFVNDGLMTGVGTFATAGTITNAGHVAPGASPGTLQIAGNYAQTAGGAFDVELGGAAGHDLLAISGSAALDGTLDLICFGACTYHVGDTILILTAAAGVQGSFAGSPVLAGFAAGAFAVDYSTPGEVLLTVTQDTVAAVPEPGSWALLLAGIAAVGSLAWRRRA